MDFSPAPPAALRYWNMASRDIAASWPDIEIPCASLSTQSPSRPRTAARKAGVLDLESGCGRETDSLLEGDGFEPSVPVATEPIYIAEGELRGDRRAAKKIWRGTNGSNPSPSSKESCANRTRRGQRRARNNPPYERRLPSRFPILNHRACPKSVWLSCTVVKFKELHPLWQHQFNRIYTDGPAIHLEADGHWDSSGADIGEVAICAQLPRRRSSGSSGSSAMLA